jgi:GNAT superfamily N-acetyltransferase
VQRAIVNPRLAQHFNLVALNFYLGAATLNQMLTFHSILSSKMHRWILNIEDCFGNLYSSRLLLFAESSPWRAKPLHIEKETEGVQTVYRLIDDSQGEALGEAVLSECEDEIRLHGIFVRPEHRGRGYARSLMETVLKLDETKAITLCTGLGNIAFFQLFGFAVTDFGESLVTMQKQP